MREGEVRIRNFVESTVLPLAATYDLKNQPVDDLKFANAPKVLLVTHALLTKCLLRGLFELGNTRITWRHNLVETGVRYPNPIFIHSSSFTQLMPCPFTVSFYTRIINGLWSDGMIRRTCGTWKKPDAAHNHHRFWMLFLEKSSLSCMGITWFSKWTNSSLSVSVTLVYLG